MPPKKRNNDELERARQERDEEIRNQAVHNDLLSLSRGVRV